MPDAIRYTLLNGQVWVREYIPDTGFRWFRLSKRAGESHVMSDTKMDKIGGGVPLVPSPESV